jgi:uncharacterized protein YciI
MTPAGQDNDVSQDVVYHLLFLNGVAGRTPTADVLARHAAHLADLDRQGKLVLAGPFLGRFGGLIVLRTASHAEAKRIAHEDPMIRAGVQSYDLLAWAQAERRNNYQPNLGRVADP